MKIYCVLGNFKQKPKAFRIIWGGFYQLRKQEEKKEL